MATERDLQNALGSGEITSMFIGGITADKKVVVFGDLTGANVSFNNASTSLAATDAQAALVELANVGLAHMHLAVPYSAGQTITTTPTKISLFDTITHNINGAVTPVIDTSEAVPAHTFTVDKTGLYAIYGTVTAEFASADAVTLMLYKNGALVYGVELQGRGAGKPVGFSYLDAVSLTATDVLEVYAKSDASTSVVVTGASMTVERKPLS